MRKTKFQRVTAFALAFVFLLCGTLGVSAVDTGDSSTTQTSLSDIKELLNAVSYNAYLEENADVPRAKTEVIIDALKNYKFVMADGTVYDENSTVDEANAKNIAHPEEYTNASKSRVLSCPERICSPSVTIAR